MNRVAVIDLGTNTFHILIVDLRDDGHYDTIFKERRYVYLGGANINKIDLEAFSRGIDTLVEFAQTMKEHRVVKYRAIGTAALRKSSNAQEFILEAKELAGINIELITGDQEALLIAKGISQLYKEDKPHLVMDIGGGSVEFIIGKTSIDWCQSFEVGISILYNRFMKTDPIDPADLDALFDYLDNSLAPLKAAMGGYDSYDLIGAAGTYEVLATYLNGELDSKLSQLNQQGIRDLFATAIPLSIDERKALDGIPSHRAQYLIVSLALIIYVLDNSQINHVYVSAYSMKEGVIADY